MLFYLTADATAADPSVGVWEQLFLLCLGFPASQTPPSAGETVQLLPHANGGIGGLRNRTNLESHESRTSDDQQIVREFRSEVVQMKMEKHQLCRRISPEILRQRLKVKKTEIQRLQRDQQSTQDSPNSWDEVNLTSIQFVCVDESVATLTSSVRRITEPAISHQPEAGSDPELF